MLPPTSHLPPIKHIATYPSDTLKDALTYLRLIYSPPVRGTRRHRCNDNSKASLGPLGTSNADRQADVVEALRNDAFERAYAIKWLTALIAQCGESPDEEEEETMTGDDGRGETDDGLLSGSSSTFPTPTRGDILVESAASLLAICAGTSAAGLITRTLVFPVTARAVTASTGPETCSEGSSISVTLTDVPLDNQDYGSVGAQTWGGACVMSEMIAENPGAFGLGQLFSVTESHPLRLLELGAGTGLVSIAIGKLVELSNFMQVEKATNKDVQIIATDYYPSVLDNLAHNVRANFPHPSTSTTNSTSTHTDLISTYPLNWFTFPALPSEPNNPLFETPFDVIYGADIIYEALHATWIKDCLKRLLRKPAHSYSTSKNGARTPYVDKEDPIFHLIIPLRSTHAVESSTIEQVFPSCIGNMLNSGLAPTIATPNAGNTVGYVGDGEKLLDTMGVDMDLIIKHKEIVICDSETGEEIDYAYYKIGWGQPLSNKL